MGNDTDATVQEQIAYYRARAGEYDRVYDERDDLRALTAIVDDLPITGDVLELACGTGQWTGRLAARARSVTAVDASPEALDIARERARGLGLPEARQAAVVEAAALRRGLINQAAGQLPVPAADSVVVTVSAELAEEHEHLARVADAYRLPLIDEVLAEFAHRGAAQAP